MTVPTAEVPTGSFLEVWGDPIAHSLSPRIHAAAYAALGWDWSYGRRRVAAADFSRELGGLGAAFRGLSLTFPLKTEAFAAATHRDRTAELTGAVNTLVRVGGQWRGFNTDVGGIVGDVRAHGLDAIETGRIVGAGATATSALVALAQLGARTVEVVARRPDAAHALAELGERLSVAVSIAAPDTVAPASVPLTVSTLPGGAALPEDTSRRIASDGGLLYDVVYGHWPTPLAVAWQAAGAPAVNGLGMLVRQAVLQIRVFRTGDVDHPLPDEDAVVDIMARALVGD
ncbi:shikimate dehydrogenase [Microbacterium sp. SCN 69-37]|uniref:shikimate dehydrogenase n=1 Tax=Microbacterium sp. SCN 69-37 TaxID=1660115 RepID=UPI00086CE8A5|nr:shikimate dehydrogenase [Microbacterium sp. SCN 69-37]ODT22456.1 MAG: shikimate dehydrogenase [Microbacterium sp. SCN 69-37]